MQIGWLGTLALMISAASSAEPAAHHAEALSPSSQWRVEYRPNDCVLSRSFGSGSDQVSLAIVRKSTFEQFDGVISGPGVPAVKGRIALVIRLLPDSAETKVTAFGVQHPDSGDRVILIENADAAILGAIAESQDFELAAGKNARIVLRLTSGKSAIGSLDKCHADLLTSWGIDPAVLKSAKSLPKPVGRPENWVTGGDYPTEAHSAGVTGRVEFAVIVDSAGKPTGCKVTRSSRSAQLDSTTCSLLMQRSKFLPATDTSGKPIAGIYSDQVNWIIPRE